MAEPWELANLFYQAQVNGAARDRGSADNMLMALFGEEAARQRPYATMPARLAEAQMDRINAEPFAERAAQRRYKYSKAGQGADETASQVYEKDGMLYTVIDGVETALGPA